MASNMQVGEIFVTINELDYKDDDIPHAKKGKFHGFVKSFSATYGLNTIPTATITVPLGSALHSDGSTSPSYVYGSKKTDSLAKLGDDSTPVGIYVRGSFFDTLGKSQVQEYCVFKGYITDTMYERSGESASMSVKLIHWLCHLTEFPLVSPLLSPQVSSDIAAQYPLSVVEDDAARMGQTSIGGGGVNFGPVSVAVELLKDTDSGTSIWDGLKALFVSLSPDISSLTETDPGYVSKPFLERVGGALEALVGEDLDFFPDTQEDFSSIKNSIANMLASLTAGYFNGSTIWDKLVNTFLPSFYMAITPRVDEANIIPAPGQCMDKKKAKKISRSEYYQTSYTRVSMPTLFGGVLLYTDPNIYSGIPAPKSSIRFPKDLQPGPLHIVTAPSWLDNDLVASFTTDVDSSTDFYSQYSFDVEKRKEREKKERKKEEESRGTITRMLENLVRVTYQVMACSGRQLSVSTPLRLDITAGEVVCLELPSGVVETTQEYYYGTVDQVILSIGTNTATTTLILSNLRTEKEMDNEDLTSSEGVLYMKAWKTDAKKVLCEEIK